MGTLTTNLNKKTLSGICMINRHCKSSFMRHPNGTKVKHPLIKLIINEKNSQKVNKTYHGSWTLNFSLTQEKKKKKSTYCDPYKKKKYFFTEKLKLQLMQRNFLTLSVFNLLEMTLKRPRWSNWFLVLFKNVIHWRPPRHRWHYNITYKKPKVLPGFC